MCLGTLASAGLAAATGGTSSIPQMLASMALSGVGNYITQSQNNRNTQRQYNAKNEVMMRGVQQQDANAARAKNVLDLTTGKFDAKNQAADLGAMIADRTKAINDNVGTPSSFVDPTSNANAPKVVQSELAKKMADAAAYSTQQGGALGKIGALNDQHLENALKINDSGNQIGTIGNFARGDYGVNQAQQNSAFHNARKAPGMFGEILSTVGNLGSMDAAGGGKGLQTIGDWITGGPGMGDQAFKGWLDGLNFSDPYSAGI